MGASGAFADQIFAEFVSRNENENLIYEMPGRSETFFCIKCLGHLGIMYSLTVCMYSTLCSIDQLVNDRLLVVHIKGFQSTHI